MCREAKAAMQARLIVARVEFDGDVEFEKGVVELL